MRAYAGHARANLSELAALLSSAEVAALATWLEQIGPEGAWETIERLRTIGLQLVEAPPSRRRALLRPLPPGEQLGARYAAVVLAQLATRLLEAISTHAVEPGGPYRSVTRRAALAAFETSNVEQDLWPFQAKGPSWCADIEDEDEED